MTENCFSTLSLPLSLSLHLNLNSNLVLVPISTEEPSIVAALSFAFKTISNFNAISSDNLIIAQVQLFTSVDPTRVVNHHKLDLILRANLSCKSMVDRGGGVIDVYTRFFPSTINGLVPDELSNRIRNSKNHCIVHFVINVCDAMGANVASTVAEGISPYLIELTNSEKGVCITSNLSPRLTTATFSVPVNKLAYKGVDGLDFALRIVESYSWAVDDIYRCCTYNKGIMNGIDGVAIATGQDWRAIEASCHAYASQNSSYKPFTSFSISKIDGEYNLLGSITIPVTCGTVGGAISSNPIYKYNLALLNNPTSKQLAMIFACVGLAQNFGALRALVTEGIQKGHMTLHANNIALAAGIDQKYVNDCVDFMVSSNRISQSCAKEYAIAHELHLEIIKPSETEKPSMFYFEEDSEFPVSINIAFKTLGENVVIQFTKNGNVYGLFGDKTHEWFTSIVKHLDSITLKTSKPTKLSRILKLLSVLANVLIRRMMIFHPQETREFVLQVLEKGCDLNISSIGIEFLDIGRPLFFSIYQVFQYRVSQWVSSLELKQGLLSQLDQVLNSLVSTTSTNLADLLKLNKTRFPITLFLLCDAITLEISSREINQVVLIAKYLECIQNIIHDIAYDKAVRDFPHASDDCGLDYGKAVNLYVLFLKMQGFSEYVINDDLMSKFLGVFSGVEDIVDGKEALVGSLLIDSDMFLEIVDRLKVYYRVQGGFGILMPALE